MYNNVYYANALLVMRIGDGGVEVRLQCVKVAKGRHTFFGCAQDGVEVENAPLHGEGALHQARGEKHSTGGQEQQHHLSGYRSQAEGWQGRARLALDADQYCTFTYVQTSTFYIFVSYTSISDHNIATYLAGETLHKRPLITNKIEEVGEVLLAMRCYERVEEDKMGGDLASGLGSNIWALAESPAKLCYLVLSGHAIYPVSVTAPALC